LAEGACMVRWRSTEIAAATSVEAAAEERKAKGAIWTLDSTA